MTEQQHLNYTRIAQAIDYLKANFKTQPSLDEVARQVHLSPFHFQRLFTDWAGVSPKAFLQFLTVEYAKSLLKSSGPSLFDVALEAGLSGTGRLHDLFIKTEGMTPGEYKAGGAQLTIGYSFMQSPFGNLVAASTTRGLCYLAFATNEHEGFEALQRRAPYAQYTPAAHPAHLNALHIFTRDWTKLDQIKLHLKGTPFQLKVWEALLKIPVGGLSTYSAIAQKIGSPNAVRAVGTAIGQNPVAFIIPCHRVIQSGGTVGQYRWGATRKAAILGWEAAGLSAAV